MRTQILEIIDLDREFRNGVRWAVAQISALEQSEYHCIRVSSIRSIAASHAPNRRESCPDP